MSFKTNKKKAFTLTELLVVVVIIGILATVALPKFNKVLVTRRTTEAEEMMRAIRTEQERRCALDKPYAADLTALRDIIPSTSTDSYDYVAQTAGMNAKSKQLNYQLQMPSYADGRICCEGEGCSQLNKDYPSCDDLRRMPDYEAPNTACAAGLPGETGDPAQCGPQPADETRSCSVSDADSCGVETRPYYCDVNSGSWQPGLGAGWNRSACTPRPRNREFVYEPCPAPQFGRMVRVDTTIYNCDGETVVQKIEGNWNTSNCITMNMQGTGYQWVLIQQSNIGPLSAVLIGSFFPPFPLVPPVPMPPGTTPPSPPSTSDIIAACAIGGAIGTINGSSAPTSSCNASNVGAIERTYNFEYASWYWQVLMGPPVCNVAVYTYQCTEV